jgi:hypothetical protein
VAKDNEGEGRRVVLSDLKNEKSES